MGSPHVVLRDAPGRFPSGWWSVNRTSCRDSPTFRSGCSKALPGPCQGAAPALDHRPGWGAASRTSLSRFWGDQFVFGGAVVHGPRRLREWRFVWRDPEAVPYSFP